MSFLYRLGHVSVAVLVAPQLMGRGNYSGIVILAIY